MPEPAPDKKSVFANALERPAAERAAYLDAACAGHPALRAEVEELLRAHAGAGSFMTAAPPAPGIDTLSAPGRDPEPTRSHPSEVERPGTVVAGRYKLLQQIGEGGMGTVWMADQTEPVKRRVAVKLIRAERGASKTILSRFEAERQAIALMSHPNIARLLDAGTTETGEPFFVMELVKGVPLTEFCDAHKLSVPDRLDLFRQICSAVHHAHQKGIIHRDLKPTNILVESHDGKPVPKVIDFGLAKATTGMQLTEHTLFTAFGTVAGTPLYMAPEQATFNAVDVDSRADIYALGVILYELLSGSTPIHKESLKTAALDEMLRVIREQEPPPPSSRISTSAATPGVAAARQSEPLKLGRYVRGELDWIVMKALAKERDRRYESATALAADVERFLNQEPVLAGPPSQWYRLRKFVRRNKARVAAVSAVLLALVAGIAGASLGLVSANRATDQAREEERKAVAERERADAYSHDLEAEQRRLRESRLHSLRLLHVSQINHAQRAADGYDTPRLVELLNETKPKPGEDDCRGWEWHYLNRLVSGWESETPLQGVEVSGQRWNSRSGMVTTRDGSRLVVPPAPGDLPRDQRGGPIPGAKSPMLPAVVIDTATGKVVASRPVGDTTGGHQISPCGRFMAYFEPVEPEAKKVDDGGWPRPGVSSRVRLLELATGQDIPVPLPPVSWVGLIRLSDDARRLTVFANPDPRQFRISDSGAVQTEIAASAVLLVWERGQEKHVRREIPTGPEKASATLGLSPDGGTAYLLHSPQKSSGPKSVSSGSFFSDPGRVLELWDLTAPEPRLLTAHKPGGSILPLGFSGSGGVLAVADADRQSPTEPPVVSLLDTRTGEPKGRWVLPAGIISGTVSRVMAVSDDGRRVVVAEGADLMVVGERADSGPATAPGRWRTHVRRSPRNPEYTGAAGRGCLNLWISPDGSRMASVEIEGRSSRATTGGALGDAVVRRTWDLTRNPEYAGTWPDQLVLDGVPCRPTPDLRTRRVSYVPPSGTGGMIGFGEPEPPVGAWSGKPPAGGWPVASYDPLLGSITHRFGCESNPSRAQLSADGTRALLAGRWEPKKGTAPSGRPDPRLMSQEFLLRTVGRVGGDEVLLRIEKPARPLLFDEFSGTVLSRGAPAPYLTSDGRWVIETDAHELPRVPGVGNIQVAAVAFKAWSAIDGKLRCTIPAEPDQYASLTYVPTPGGGRLIVQTSLPIVKPLSPFEPSGTRTICYDPRTGAKLWVHDASPQSGFSEFMRLASFSTDGRLLALVSLGFLPTATRVQFVDTANGTVVRELRGGSVTGGLPGSMVNLGTMGPNGSYAVCAGGQVFVWDGQNPEPVHRLAVQGATQAVFSADGRRLFTLEHGARFGTTSGAAIRVWDLTTGRELLVIRLPREDAGFRQAAGQSSQPRMMWLQGERLMLWGDDGIRVFDGTPAGK